MNALGEAPVNGLSDVGSTPTASTIFVNKALAPHVYAVLRAFLLVEKIG